MTQRRKIVVVLKGYPRLSETFIAQELLGLERVGFDLELVALRRPTDKKRHPINDEIRAPVRYLPEYLHDDPARVGRAFLACLAMPGLWRGLAALFVDFARDRTRNRLRRFGQAMVLCAEWPAGGEWLHAHFIHTPASVARYASMIRGTPFTVSAHAKDIWTSPDWDLAGKLKSTRWTVTCTQTGFERLSHLAAEGGAPVHLSYHGLDLGRFGHFKAARSGADGTQAKMPVTILSVGRAVEKKGYDVLLQALSLLPANLNWRFDHVGGGDQLPELKALADRLGIAQKLHWHGALSQDEVLQHYRTADVFALACRIAADGDRDGLPNVLVEASSQALVCVSTEISGVPELVTNGENGLLVPSDDPQALAEALERVIRDPALRQRLGAAAEEKVRSTFDHHTSIRQLTGLFEAEWRSAS